MADDFAGVEVLATWVHGPGVFHTTEPVERLGDLRGMKIRGGSRMVTQLLERAGAEAIGMPVTQIPEALSRGVLDGTTLPWEVTTAFRIPELTGYHTEFEGAALYTLTFVIAMNDAAYAALPDDLRAVIDAQSGEALSIFAGGGGIRCGRPGPRAGRRGGQRDRHPVRSRRRGMARGGPADLRRLDRRHGPARAGRPGADRPRPRADGAVRPVDGRLRAVGRLRRSG